MIDDITGPIDYEKVRLLIQNQSNFFNNKSQISDLNELYLYLQEKFSSQINKEKIFKLRITQLDKFSGVDNEIFLDISYQLN